MEKIERVEVDLLRIGKQMYKFRSGFGGGVCSDEEWLWCSCLGNLETYFVHQNWIRHTRLDKLAWCHVIGSFWSWSGSRSSGPRTVPSTDQVWALFEKWVAQSSLTLCDPMGYTVYGILQARTLEWVAVPFSKGSSQPRDWTQVSHCRRILFCQPPGKPKNTGVGSLYPISRRSSWPSNQIGVSCTAGGFFTSWATRKAV